MAYPKKYLCSCFTLALAMLALSAQAASFTFQQVNSVQPPGLKNSRGEFVNGSVAGISADGSTVVGNGYSSMTGPGAYTWSGGELTFLPLGSGVAVSEDGSVVVYNDGVANVVDSGSNVTAYPSFVSSDGSTLAGSATVTMGGSSQFLPFVWTSAAGTQLCALPESTYTGGANAFGSMSGLSANGNVIIGIVRSTPGSAIYGSLLLACSWHADGTVYPLETPLGTVTGNPAGVSADGSLIAGFVSNDGVHSQACVWSGTAYQPLPDLGGVFKDDTQATGITPDGQFIIGFDNTRNHGILWTGTTPQDLGKINPSSISADGQIVAGELVTERQDAGLWDRFNGVRSLRTVVEEDPKAPRISGFQKFTVIGVTNTNGVTTLVGTASVPVPNTERSGYTDGWVLTTQTPAGPDIDPFAGSLFEKTASFTPTLKLTESYREALGRYYIPPDQGIPASYYYQPTATFKSVFSMTASMAGLDTSSLGSDTTVQLVYGSFALTGSLGMDPAYSPGKTSATFSLGDGNITFSWTPEKLIVNANLSLVENLASNIAPIYSRLSSAGFAVPIFLGHSVSSSFAFPIYLRFANLSGSHIVPFVVNGDVHSVAADGSSYLLDKLTIESSLDYAPPVPALNQPAKNANVLTPNIFAQVDSTGKTSLDHLVVSLNGGPEESVFQLDGAWIAPLTLQPGVNTFTFQAIDINGDASPVLTSSVDYLEKAGIYTSLLLDGSSTPQGLVSLTMSDNEAFTTKVIIGKSTFSASGQADQDGNATVMIAGGSKQPLTLSLHLAVNGVANEITGSVTDNEALDLSFDAARATYNSALPFSPYKNAYTLLFPASGALNAPLGYGFGTLTVDSTGLAKITGELADGSKITYAAPIDGLGRLPIYSTAGPAGNFSGTLTFESLSGSDCDGDILWVKPSRPKGPYSAGFSEAIAAEGCVRGYLNANFQSSKPNADFVFTGGGLGSPYTVPAQLSYTYSLAGTAPAGFKLKGDGGVFINTATGKSAAFHLTIYAKQNLVAGYFLGPDQDGSVVVTPKN